MPSLLEQIAWEAPRSSQVQASAHANPAGLMTPAAIASVVATPANAQYKPTACQPMVTSAESNRGVVPPTRAKDKLQDMPNPKALSCVGKRSATET